MRKFSVVALLFITFSSCQNSTVHVKEKIDTVVVAYIENGHWRFNKAIAWTHLGRTFVSDSGLEAKEGPVTQMRLLLPSMKSDSMMDSVKHLLISITERYQPLFLSDTLTHYLHILDTLHSK